MPRDCVTTVAAPKTPAYSQAVKAAGLVFVSGQAGIDPATGELAGATVQEQTRQCLKNVSAVLEAAGTSLDNIVTATFILRDAEDFAGMNEEWQAWFPTDPPGEARSQAPDRCGWSPCVDRRHCNGLRRNRLGLAMEVNSEQRQRCPTARDDAGWFQ